MKPRLSDDTSWQRNTPASKCVGEIPWRYSLAEVRADGAVHAVGVTLAVMACLGYVLDPPGGREGPAVGIYLATLVGSLTLSALYNLWPVSRRKWLLRRFDHSAIYLLIAGTYTPFAVQLEAWLLLGAVWTVAACGVGLKLFRAGRGDTLSIGLYLALGWSGIVMGRVVAETFSATTLWLIGAGAFAYTFGVLFHVWERLPYQNAVWHGFVLAGAILHYGAVWSVLPMRI